jgi:cell division inhibitor SepF
MPGVWKRALNYLGLVEDEGYEDLDEVEAEAPLRTEPMAVRSVDRSLAAHPASRGSHETVVRTITQPRPGSAIHKSEPRRFNDARDLGDRFRAGVPVIMNLQSTEDNVARRLVDFASGLVYGLDGKIELVATRVYLLTPANVEVSAEERERLREGGFFNQF